MCKNFLVNINMFKKISAILFFVFFSFLSSANKNELPLLKKQILEDKLKIKIHSSEKKTNLNLYMIDTDQGIFYTDKNANNLFMGNILDISNGLEIVNITENHAKKIRSQNLKKIEKTAIVYKAKNEKYKVFVFSDPDCVFCQRLHESIGKYNDLGISIHYLAFPRSGLNSPASEKLESIWCSKNQNKSMDNAKKGKNVIKQNCATSPVGEHYNLGIRFGVKGTPALVASDGSMFAGFVKPDELIKHLEN